MGKTASTPLISELGSMLGFSWYKKARHYTIVSQLFLCYPLVFPENSKHMKSYHIYIKSFAGHNKVIEVLRDILRGAIPLDAATSIEIVAVRQGFSLLALFFGPFWMLYHGMWLNSCIYLLMQLFLPLELQIMLAISCGLYAHDVLGHHLTTNGFQQEDIVVASNPEQATLRFIIAQSGY